MPQADVNTSPGTRQRLRIAQTLTGEPSMLILEELVPVVRWPTVPALDHVAERRR